MEEKEGKIRWSEKVWHDNAHTVLRIGEKPESEGAYVTHSYEMDVIYIEGDGMDFKRFIDEHYKDKSVDLRNIGGKNRWVITRPDGSEYIARPASVLDA